MPKTNDKHDQRYFLFPLQILPFSDLWYIIPSFSHVPLLTFLAVPPERVVIEGPRAVSADRGATYTCRVINANPVPDVVWVVDGSTVPSTKISQKRSSSHSGGGGGGGSGWTVEAKWILEDILEEDTQISIKCIAHSPAITSHPAEDSINVVVLSK